MGALQHIEHQISAINELIKINNDRITGYEKAIENSADTDLKPEFEAYIAQSKANNIELREYIHVLGGSPAEGTTLAGKFYHTWQDIKGAFISKDRHSILEDCEFGEDVAGGAYRKAMDDKELIWEDDKVVSILTHQYDELRAAHNKIKALRDATVSA